MLAAYHGHADLVKLLMEHGADPNRLNDRGQSPLAGSVFKMEDAVVEVSNIALIIAITCSSFADMLCFRLFSRGVQTPNTALRQRSNASPCSIRTKSGRQSLRLLLDEERRSLLPLLFLLPVAKIHPIANNISNR